MTNDGIWLELKKDEKIKKLKSEIKRQKEINKAHQELNGKLRVEVDQLKSEISKLETGNFICGVYRDDGIKDRLKSIILDMIKQLEAATPLVRKYPKSVLFKKTIESLAKHAKKLNEIYRDIKKKVN